MVVGKWPRTVPLFPLVTENGIRRVSKNGRRESSGAEARKEAPKRRNASQAV